MTFKTRADGSTGVNWEATLPITATASTVVKTLLSFAISAGYAEEGIIRAMKNTCDDYDRYKDCAEYPERVLS